MLRRRTILKAAETPTGDLNTKLLLHFDGSVVDASPYSVPVLAEAGTSFAAGKFGQGFIGKNSSSAADPSPITTPDGYISDIIKGDFTFECWFEESTISNTARQVLSRLLLIRMEVSLLLESGFHLNTTYLL